MRRKKQNLDGLSLPINSIVVVLQLLSILGIMASFLPCLHFLLNYILWPSVVVFGVSALLLFVFKGFPLFVFYGRFVLGFVLVGVGLVQATFIDQFQLFIAYVSDDVRFPSNTIAFLHENVPAVAISMVVITFVAGIALLIGAWVRYVSIAAALLFVVCGLAFWNLMHMGAAIDESVPVKLWDFNLDHYLSGQLSYSFCFVFACCMFYIAGMGIAFGHKIYPNSVKLNWYLLPILTGLSAGFSVMLHWYTPLFLIPLTLMACLLIYRSGGKLLANHFGSLIVALVLMICFIEFQKPLGIGMKPGKEIKTGKMKSPDHANLDNTQN